VAVKSDSIAEKRVDTLLSSSLNWLLSVAIETVSVLSEDCIAKVFDKKQLHNKNMEEQTTKHL
jgi:hypothetical protein